MIGIGQHSYTEAWRPNSGAKFNNALTFLEYANSIGASGVQVAIKPDEQPNAAKIRARCEELNAYFEGNVVLPKTDADVVAFEAHIAAIKTAGASVARTACLSGRRYETFKSLEEFNDFKATSIKALTRAEPIVRKHKIKLAVENHKDWLAEEHVAILRGLSSEWIGALIDTGNNIALLDNPYEHIEALAPFAFSSHLKDMAVQEYEHGFLLSEVPLATGYLDIPKIVSLLREANPQIRLNLEMITRDPLNIPCLDQPYYATFTNPPASRLARAVADVKRNACTKLLHTTGLSAGERIDLEDRNVRESIIWAKAHLKA
ncbi:MAG TPA: TIM barrel protein [Verrucomicrobiae bacterium]|nr:TIM barrel protein [Verrucomicrobiae bacterium]